MALLINLLKSGKLGDLGQICYFLEIDKTHLKTRDDRRVAINDHITMAPDKEQEVRNMIAKFNNEAKRQKAESS